MSALSIQVPFPVFQDRDGQPLDNGYVWLGTSSLNPQTNPVVAYYDSALTIVATQPLRTLNGFISRAGSPAQVYVDAVNFSILVQDRQGTTVFSVPEGTGISPNASGVVYDPSGTGAVATTVQSKLRESVSVVDFGAATGASAAANYTAFAAATTHASANGLGITIPAGTYSLSTNWVLTTTGLRVTAIGKVVLLFTNAGNCVSVDGGAATTSIYDVHFGTRDNPIFIGGNSSTTSAIFWRAAHHGSCFAKVWNCVIGFRTQFAVGNDFGVVCSASELPAASVLVPTTGISCERRSAGEDTADNNYWNPIIEGVTTSTGHGIYLGYTNRNKFWGGTSEGNVIGVYASSTAVGDNVNGLYCEVNTGAAHFDISGTLITLTDCFGSTSAPTPTVYARFRTGATDCRVLGGNIPGITIDAGAVRTQVIGNAHSTGTIVTDNGTGTLIIQGQAASKLTYGSKFGSGTTYVLDFYDAGTITATMICGTSGTITLNATYNKLGWVKIGRLVTVTGLLIVDSVSSPVGVVSIGTLTYATDSAPSSRAAAAIRVDQLTAGATTQIMGKIGASSTTIQLESYAAGATDYSIADYIKAGTEIQISLSYIAAT